MHAACLSSSGHQSFSASCLGPRICLGFFSFVFFFFSILRHLQSASVGAGVTRCNWLGGSYCNACCFVSKTELLGRCRCETVEKNHEKPIMRRGGHTMTCLQAGARQVDEEDSAAGKAFQHKLLTQTEWIHHIVRCPCAQPLRNVRTLYSKCHENDFLFVEGCE